MRSPPRALRPNGAEVLMKRVRNRRVSRSAGAKVDERVNERPDPESNVAASYAHREMTVNEKYLRRLGPLKSPLASQVIGEARVVKLGVSLAQLYGGFDQIR